MRFSVWPTLAQPWDEILEVSRHAEATGWDGVYVMDHFMGNDGPPGAVEVPTLEGTAALAALAAATDGSASAPSCSATPTATPPSSPTGRPPSTTSATAACSSGSAPAGR